MASLPQRTQQVIVSELSSIDTLLNHHGLHLLIITRIICHPPPSGGYFSTSTCSSLPRQQYNNEANPPSNKPSTTASKPPSPETFKYLSTSAMQVKCLTQNSRSTYTGNNRCTQHAANTNNYSTAIALACSSQFIATIGPDNILQVNKLYTPPIPDRGHPNPNSATPHQPNSLTGDICHTILHSKKNKGTGINSDSINLFITLVKSTIPSVKPDLRLISNTIYQNNLSDVIKRYFTDVYLFCLHKDPNNHSKLHPLGIPTAIRKLISTHVARSLKSKFAPHLLLYNYAVNILNGTSFVIKAMQLAIKKFFDAPQ
jgi:hypothetical protein